MSIALKMNKDSSNISAAVERTGVLFLVARFDPQHAMFASPCEGDILPTLVDSRAVHLAARILHVTYVLPSRFGA